MFASTSADLPFLGLDADADLCYGADGLRFQH